jgi:hypothetical protein
MPPTYRRKVVLNLDKTKGNIVFSPTSLVKTTDDYTGVTKFTVDITSHNNTQGTLGISQIDYQRGVSPWIALAAINTTTNPKRLEITLNDVDALNMSDGTYYANIYITDSNALNSPTIYPVKLTVINPVLQSSLVLDKYATIASLIKGASGVYTVDVACSSATATPNGTITVASVTGTGSAIVTTSKPNATTVRVTLTENNALAIGSYAIAVNIADSAASNSPQTFTVNFDIVASTATLYVDRNIFDSAVAAGGSYFSQKVIQIKTTSPSAPTGFNLDSKTYTGTSNGDWCNFSVDATGLVTIDQQAAVSNAGGSYCTAVFSAANGANTVTITMYILVGAAAPLPYILVSASAVGLSCNTGSKCSTAIVNVSNAGGTLASLGTVTVQLLGASGLNTSYNSTTGDITITDPSNRNTPGTFTDTIRISANGANVQNTPLDIPVTITVTTVAPVTKLGPRTAALPNGYTWDSNIGAPVGSVFNTLPSYRGADNRAMPAFNGTVYNVNSQADWNNVTSLLIAGTIVDGDVIQITAGVSLLDCQLPARGGWSYGTGGFVQIRTSGHASLPAYQKDPGPTNQGAANRVDYATHSAYLAQIRTDTANASPLCTQTSCGGYWFTGIDFYSNYNGPTSGILNIRAYTGLNTSQQNTPSQCPSQIVFDRCTIRSRVNHKITVIADGRHLAFYHCDFMEARFDPSNSGSWENKAVLIFNTPGQLEFIGNSLPSRGIGILCGGGLPSMTTVVPADVMIAWNKMYDRPNAQTEVDSDDCYARLELKTGGRFAFMFNDIRHIYYRTDHQFHVLFKATDQAKVGGGTVGYTSAHVYDLIMWGNRIRNSGKGLIGGADKYNNSATLGCERIEAAWNFCEMDPLYIPSKWGTYLAETDRRNMEFHRSAGDGMNIMDIYHNTFVNVTQCMMNIDEGQNYAGSGWRGIKIVDNVQVGKLKYGPIFGSAAGGNSQGLNNVMGAGNWTWRKNFCLSPTTGYASWDSTLLSANYQNGYIPDLTHFNDPASYDYSLKNTTVASASYVSGGGGTDGLDCGYDHAYLINMVNGVGD